MPILFNLPDDPMIGDPLARLTLQVGKLRLGEITALPRVIKARAGR